MPAVFNRYYASHVRYLRGRREHSRSTQAVADQQGRQPIVPAHVIGSRHKIVNLWMRSWGIVNLADLRTTFGNFDGLGRPKVRMSYGRHVIDRMKRQALGLLTATVRSGVFMRKIAIITGASSGIGGATAVALAERGVDSIVTFNSHEDRVRDVADAVRQRRAKAVPLRLDVGESGSFAAFRSDVIAALDSEWKASSFDYLVNNAGFLQMALFEDTTEELFDAYMRVLFKGPYFLTQALLPVLANGGSIVNVTSNSICQSGIAAGVSAYASMKGGLT
jgi:hypothetical protein